MDGWREGGIAGGKNEGRGGKRKGRMEKGRDGYVGACMTHGCLHDTWMHARHMDACVTHGCMYDTDACVTHGCLCDTWMLA